MGAIRRILAATFLLAAGPLIVGAAPADTPATPATRPADANPPIVVSGVVVDPDDRPAIGASVTLFDVGADAPIAGTRLGATTSGDDGSFHIEAFKVPPPPGVYYQLAVVAAKAGLANGVQLVSPRPPGESPNLRIALTQPTTVSGVITDRAGRRVANARVRVISVGSSGATAGGAEAVSGKDGRFTITDFPTGRPMEFHVTAPGFADLLSRAYERIGYAGTYGPFGWGVEDPKNIRMQLRPEGRLAGTVIDAQTGRAVAGVTLRFHRKTCASDAAGRFEFAGLGPDPSNSLTVISTTTAPEWIAAGQSPRIRAAEGRAVGDLRFNVMRPALLEVSCRDRQTHQPVRPAALQLQSPASPGGQPLWFSPGPDGRTIVAAPPGSWQVSPVNTPGYQNTYESRRLVELRRQDPPQTLMLDLVPAASGIPKIVTREFTVLDPASQPADGATVAYLGRNVPTTQTDREGRFSMEGMDGPYPEMFIIRKNDLYYLRYYGLAPDRKRSETLVLKPLPTVAFTVLDPDGRPIAGAKINSRYPGQSNPWTDWATFPELATDASGRCSARTLWGSISSSRAWAVKDGYASRYVDFRCDDKFDPIEVPPFVLAPLDQTVAGVVVDHEERPVPGVKVRVYPPWSFLPNVVPIETVSDSVGRFALARLPRGPLNLGAGGQVGPVRLSGYAVVTGGDQHVKVILRPATRLSPALGSYPYAGYPAATTRPAAGPLADPDAAIAKVIAELKRPTPPYLANRMQELADSVRPAADRAVKALTSLLDEETSYALQMAVMQLLAELGTPAARAVLLENALGRGAAASKGYLKKVAFDVYLWRIVDREGVMQLLEAGDPGIASQLLWWFIGRPVDEQLLARIEQLIRQAESGPHQDKLFNSAASVLANDPDSRLAEKKIDLLLSMVNPATTRPDVESAPPALGTAAYAVRVECPLNGLSAMLKADAPLRARTERLHGLARDVVIAARACRGDESVHDEIVQMLKDDRSDTRRQLAATALQTIGRREDLPALNAAEDALLLLPPATQPEDRANPQDLLGDSIRATTIMIDMRSPLPE